MIILHHHRTPNKIWKNGCTTCVSACICYKFLDENRQPVRPGPYSAHQLNHPIGYSLWKLTKWNLKITIKIKWEGISEDVTQYMYKYVCTIYNHISIHTKYIYMYILICRSYIIFQTTILASLVVLAPGWFGALVRVVQFAGCQR